MISSFAAAGNIMDRRKFISSSVAAGATLVGTGLIGKPGNATGTLPPNILLIIVDEMRYPKVFPSGVNDVGQFLAMFMPNTYKLWQNGVKFTNHNIAASACSPSRSTLVTGLYSHQNWITQTILDFPGASATQPVLSPVFPTYGSLLLQAGYQTPYIGKWHLSIPSAAEGGLSAYGFDYMTYPDPTGSNLQGTYGNELPDPDVNSYHNDQYIAAQAATWLGARQPGGNPWCLTVGFVNPHDKEFFPAGTEYQTFADLFPAPPGHPEQLQPYATQECAIALPSQADNILATPLSYGYPAVPPNWESAAQIATNKPSTQTFARLFQQLAFGGVSDHPSETGFKVVPYPSPPGQYGVGIVPYSYWQRSLDSYTQIMNILDVNIGTVLDALPTNVAQNTVIVFTSDHGDYASAHGFVSGKVGTCYDECLRVPLIVVDPTEQFTGDIGIPRQQLTSEVDIAPLLVSLGYGGSREWISGDLRALYGQRYDMLPLLRSNQVQGRQHAVFATDELVPGYLNYRNFPLHIVGLVTENAKLGTYAHWFPLTTAINRLSLEREFYDYNTPGGQSELDNMPDDPRAIALQAALLNDIIPNELRAPLPGKYGLAQAVARAKQIAYSAIINNLRPSETGLRVGF
jgi:arylsulfatase A-like enzyme